MRQKCASAAVIGAALATACTTTPNVTAGYYLPQGELMLTVTRTVGCGSRKVGSGDDAPTVRALHSIAAVAPALTYSADISARVEIPINQLDGPIADTAMGFEFSDDGRLRGINSATTGRGTEIVQAVAGLAPLLVGAASAPGSPASVADQTRVNDACDAIAEAVGADKALTVVYELNENFRERPGANGRIAPRRVFEPTHRSPSLDAVEAQLPPICADFGDPEQVDQAATWNGTQSPTAPHLTLRRLARYRVTVYQFERQAGDQPGDAGCAVGDERRQQLWAGTIQVPLVEAASRALFNDDPGTYRLPIPRSAPFGGNSFKLGLAESGAINVLQYGNVSGAAGPIGAVTAVGSAAGETDAERAARYQHQADLIAQQQRLIKCQQNREACE